MVAINLPRCRARAARPAHHRGFGAHKAGAEKVTLPRTHARRPADGARQPSGTSAMPSWDFWFRVWTFCHFPCNEAAYNLQPLPQHCSAQSLSLSAASPSPLLLTAILCTCSSPCRHYFQLQSILIQREKTSLELYDLFSKAYASYIIFEQRHRAEKKTSRNREHLSRRQKIFLLLDESNSFLERWCWLDEEKVQLRYNL